MVQREIVNVPKESITEMAVKRAIRQMKNGNWSVPIKNHSCSFYGWAEDSYEDLPHGDGWGNITDRLVVKYHYAEILAEIWSIVV